MAIPPALSWDAKPFTIASCAAVLFHTRTGIFKEYLGQRRRSWITHELLQGEGIAVVAPRQGTNGTSEDRPHPLRHLAFRLAAYLYLILAERSKGRPVALFSCRNGPPTKQVCFVGVE